MYVTKNNNSTVTEKWDNLVHTGTTFIVIHKENTFNIAAQTSTQFRSKTTINNSESGTVLPIKKLNVDL